MKRIPLAFVALACAAFMVGCNKADDTAAGTTGKAAGKTADSGKADTPADPIVGTWTTDIASEKVKMTAEVEFKADKTMVFGILMKPDDKDDVKMALDGTYKLDGGHLTAHYTKAEPVEVTGPKAAALKASIKTPALPPDEDSSITWSGNDEFISTDAAGKTQSFKRKVG
jgi:hypothetical protein